MHNDVVEHIFMYGEIVCGNDERDTHYYITRGRVGAPGISLRQGAIKESVHKNNREERQI